MLSGSPTRQELVACYAAASADPMPDMLFYYCFGLFKLAVIIQQIYTRFVRGLTKDARFARLNERVESLGLAGMHTLEAGRI